MSFEQISYLAQIVASVGVIVSLIFVGLQIRQNTGALQRNEHNSTMAQWTVIRMAIAQNRDIAELMTAGLHGERAMDAADQLRLEQMCRKTPGRLFTFGTERSVVFFRKGLSKRRVGHSWTACSEHRAASWWRKTKHIEDLARPGVAGREQVRDTPGEHTRLA